MARREPVSVVIPTRDRPAMLARCVAAVREAIGPDDEIVVVDSASTDAAAVREAAAPARVVRCDLPGVCRARNAGWRAAAHEVVLFADDDVRVDPLWADRFAACFAAHPDTGFATGRVEAEYDRWTRRPVALKEELEPAVIDTDSRGNLGHSASLGVRRTALADVGGFDEALGAGGFFGSAPEYDLFDRLLGAGHTGRYEPEALAFHHQWRTPRQLFFLDLRYGYGLGARLAKLLRVDRRRAKRVVGDAFVWTKLDVRMFVRQRDPLMALAALLRLFALAPGVVRGLTFPLQAGHYDLDGRVPKKRAPRGLGPTSSS